MEENAAIVSFEDLHGLISTPDISKRLKVKNNYKETKQPVTCHVVAILIYKMGVATLVIKSYTTPFAWA